MTDRQLRVAIAALALVGAAIAGYLTYAHYADRSVFCISGGSGCEKVQQSSYAEVAGIPVALLGLCAYIALFLTALSAGRTAVAAGAAIALTGVLFSLWLLYAQLALIDAVCQWCLANDVVVTLAAVAAVLRLRQST